MTNDIQQRDWFETLVVLALLTVICIIAYHATAKFIDALLIEWLESQMIG